VEFDHPAIRRQELAFAPLDAERFEREISSARTFGFLREVEALWEAGFARGGCLDNTVVLDDEKVVNPEGLRFRDEFVRHKVLDLCGDLALLGTAVQGHVRVERGGHALHQMLVEAILARPEAWVLIDPEVGGGRALDLSRLAAAATRA
jgi:UDP-3-O-[3-hydroxymyristoyl] N-acetylglucosamine deacetylase